MNVKLYNLQPYKMGNKTCVIEAVGDGLHVKFNCWYTKDKTAHLCVSFHVEAFYVKRVRIV